MKNRLSRFVSVILALILALAVLPAAEAENPEIVSKGGKITWVDASVQLPYNYSSIIGFRVQFKLLTDHTDYVSGYGGVTEDPNSPEYNMKFPCYMLIAARGAHGTDEFNSDAFYCAKNENYEHYTNAELAKQEIVKIGMGAGFYVAGYLDNGRAYTSLSGMKAGSVGTAAYQGTQALFEQGSPIMTFYGYTADYEILSIEWITGVPVITAQEDLAPVEKKLYADISTAEADDSQNGFNYVNIWTPRDGEGPFPVVLWIHGGAWSTSSRTDIILNTTMEYFLSRGYAFVSAEYTLSERSSEGGEVTITNDTQGRQMLYDLKQAVRFLRANGEKYRLDADFICAMGESAGAHLALLMASTNGDEEHEAWDVEAMDWKDYSSDVQCAVAYSAPTDLTDESVEFLADYAEDYPLLDSIGEDAMRLSNCYMASCIMGYDFMAEHEGYDELIECEEFMSPFYQINSDTPALYLIHGEKDEAVLIHHAYAIELAGKIYMDEGAVKTAYWADAGHVDKKYFDSYAQYTSTFEFVDSLRREQ